MLSALARHRRWSPALAFGLALLGAPPSASAGEDCQVSPQSPAVTLLEMWNRCPGSRDRVTTVIRQRGDGEAPELVALFQHRPDLRSAAVDGLRTLGQPGVAGISQLGSEGVRAMAGVWISGNGWLDVLRGLGPPALETLGEMLYDSDPDIRRFAAQYLPQLGPASLDALLKAMEASPDPDVRYACARGAARLDAQRALPGLLRLLQRRDLKGRERVQIASTLISIDDPAAIQALVAILRDPSLDRGARWGLAQDMKRSGRPAAVAAARKYGPTGSHGQGNPESPLGSILALLLLAGVVAAIALWRASLTVKERVRLVVGGTVGAYLAAAVAMPAAAILALGMGAAPLWLLASFWICQFAGALVCVALTKGPQLRAAYIPAVGIGATLGFVAGFMLDRTVNWYLERVTGQLLGFYESPLVLALTLAGALLGSYVVRPRQAGSIAER
jgi:hypothetical protein